MSTAPPRDDVRASSPRESGATRADRATRPAGFEVGKELVLAVLLFILIDAAVFHTGFYRAVLAPESYAGQVAHLVAAERARPATATREVLLLGDSRMAEGFSAKRADQASEPGDFKFINASVSGSTLRTEAYLLRELDPTAHRYAAIVVGMDNYDDLSAAEDLADRNLDLAIVSPLLRYSDLVEFPWTFESSQNRAAATADILLGGVAFRLDVQDLLTDPLKRAREVRAYQLAGTASLYEYTGHPGSLAGLQYDATSGYVFPAGLSASARDQLTAELRAKLAPPHSTTAYREEWLSRILERYHDSSVQFIMVQMPRGPIVPPTTHTASFEAIDSVAHRPHMTVLPATAFSLLERPDLFFDALHLNVEGREQFTDALSGAIRVLLNDASVGASRSATVSPWQATSPGGWSFDFLAGQHATASGLYERDAGLTFVQPDFSFDVPAPHPSGVLRVHGYLPPEFDRLLPLTIRVGGPGGYVQQSSLTEPGPFTLDVPVGASDRTQRLDFHVDKSLIPRDIQLNQDERALSIGLLGLEYINGDAGQ